MKRIWYYSGKDGDKMKGKFKFISFSLVILSVLVFSFGCTPTDNILPEDTLEEEILMDLGFLNDKYITEDKQFIIIETNEESLELEILDNDLFDDLELDEYYIVSYNEKNVVRSININEYLKSLVTDSMEEGPDSQDSVIISKSEKFNTDNLTLLDAYIMDINNNGKDEKITMYTRAEKDMDGEVMWDDGQDWIILVEGEDNDYVLFNDYVQLGTIQLFVYTIEDDLYISTVHSGTANLTLTEYKFNRETEEFHANTEFRTEGNVNMIFSTK